MARNPEIAYGLVERAANSGSDTLFFIVDVPVSGARLRDVRDGFSIPPRLTLRTLTEVIPHVR